MVYGLIAGGADLMGVRPENDHSGRQQDDTVQPYWTERSYYQLNSEYVTPENPIEPFRYTIARITPDCWPPVWVKATSLGNGTISSIAAIPQGGTMPTLVENETRVTLFWAGLGAYQAYSNHWIVNSGGSNKVPLPYCRINMLWNGSSWISDAQTKGHLWTSWYSQLDASNEMLAFFGAPLEDVLIYVRCQAKFMIGIPVFVVNKKIRKVIPEPIPGPEHPRAIGRIRTYAGGTAIIGEWAWLSSFAF
jgi:hypothetical protein